MRGSVALALGLLVAACSAGPAPAPPTEGTRKANPPGVPESSNGGPVVNLPKEAGAWSRGDVPRRIDAEGIFDYMDGGGELYLGYGFRHLDVYEYKAANGGMGTLLVELYWMRTSDDAFGLLSCDWTGEVVDLGGLAPRDIAPATPPARALYGAGLLRAWSDDLYLRILATNETPAARDAVLAIARAIALGRQNRAGPRVLARLPTKAGRGSLTLRPDRTCFFRSYLVLNSAYFVSSEDILNLSPEVEGVTSEYRIHAGSRRVRAVALSYPSLETAAGALKSFHEAYLQETAGGGQAPSVRGAARVEQGWVAWSLAREVLVIVFDADGERSGQGLADELSSAVRAGNAKPGTSGGSR